MESDLLVAGLAVTLFFIVFDSAKGVFSSKEPLFMSIIFTLIFALSILARGNADADYFFEILALAASNVLMIKFFVRWYASLSKTRQPGLDRSGKTVFAFLPAVSFLIIFITLKLWASYDVINSPVYITFYIVLGYAWVYVGLMLMFVFFDLSWHDDAVNLNNRAAMIAAAGGFIALTMIYSGANIGDGPGWWCVFYAGGLGVAAWISLSQIVDSFTDVFERITVERDVACGIRMCCYWLAGGLLLGRASAGDWTSFDMTDIEFEDKWPIIPLTVIVILIELYYTHIKKTEGRNGGGHVLGSIACGVFFIIFAAVSLIFLLPPLPINPMYRNVSSLITALRGAYL